MISPLRDDITANQERKKILIVEDNTETQLILKIYLRDFYDVDIVQTASEALKKIRKVTYALIILDINLPGELDGNDVIKTLKNDPEFNQIPILVVTAYALKGDREKYLSMGANGYLAKPVGKHNIIGIVNELVS